MCFYDDHICMCTLWDMAASCRNQSVAPKGTFTHTHECQDVTTSCRGSAYWRLLCMIDSRSEYGKAQKQTAKVCSHHQLAPGRIEPPVYDFSFFGSFW
jgi:hypothetical protein